MAEKHAWKFNFWKFLKILTFLLCLYHHSCTRFFIDILWKNKITHPTHNEPANWEIRKKNKAGRPNVCKTRGACLSFQFHFHPARFLVRGLLACLIELLRKLEEHENAKASLSCHFGKLLRICFCSRKVYLSLLREGGVRGVRKQHRISLKTASLRQNSLKPKPQFYVAIVL